MSASPTLGIRLQRLFLTGVLTLLPIWLTWVVVAFVFKLLSGLSRPLVDPLLARASALDPRTLAWLQDPWVQTALALLATLAVILLAGWLARRVVGQRLLRWFEAVVARIPLASLIYGSARKLLDILQTQPDGTQRVGLIDFPHDKMKSVGFAVLRARQDYGGGFRPPRDPRTGHRPRARRGVRADHAEPDFRLPGDRAGGEHHAHRLDRRPGDELHHLRWRGLAGQHSVLRARDARLKGPLDDRATRLFIGLAAFFCANAVLAEFIGVKIFALEDTLGLRPWEWNLFGQSGSLNFTAGTLL